MNELAMQNDRPGCRTNVRELPVIWLGRRRRTNLRPVSGVFLHPVKMDVRLVSFPLSGVRNDLAKTKICQRDTPFSTVVAGLRSPHIVVKKSHLATSVAAMFSPVRSLHRFPPQSAAMSASRERRALGNVCDPSQGREIHRHLRLASGVASRRAVT